MHETLQNSRQTYLSYFWVIVIEKANYLGRCKDQDKRFEDQCDQGTDPCFVSRLTVIVQGDWLTKNILRL